MVAVLSEFLIYAILIHKIASANEAFDKKIENGFGHVEKDEHSLPFSSDLYGKRVNYALMPLMGGMYGKRTFVPFHGGMYGKRRSIPFTKYYNKQLLSPTIKLNEENIICIPPSIPAKDSQDVDCCKLPQEIFPHKTIYEEFCSVLYFGIMADGPDGRFCRLSTSQKRQTVDCDPGWITFYEGLNQFCYKAFTINSTDTIVDIMSRKDGDPCRKKRKTASLVRIPNQNINMFIYVKVLNGEKNLVCDSVDRNTYYYYIGLYRNDFDWRWRSYDEKAYSHLEEQGQQLLDYLNTPRPNHTWPDGTHIFANGWHDVEDITTNVVMSNCHFARMCADTLPTTVPETGDGNQSEDQDVEFLEVDPNIKELDLTRYRIKKIEELDFLNSIEYLCLRWNLIKKIENLHMLVTLTELDLYDNQISKIENLDELINLESLDLSFNRITVLENLSSLKKLKYAYFVHNKIEKIQGLEELAELEYLELGDNRIKKIENLSKNFNIKRLFLGANQIVNIENLDMLMHIEVLSLPANAIQEIKGLNNLATLRELYLSQNGIQYITGLENNINLEILDLNHNRLRSISNIRHLHKLTDFWAKKNQLDNMAEVNELVQLPNLKLVYLEMNPFSTCSTYRSKVIHMLPQIEKLDATYCRDVENHNQ